MRQAHGSKAVLTRKVKVKVVFHFLAIAVGNLLGV